MQKKCIYLTLLKKYKIFLSLHYNGANSYLFVNGTEIIKFKAKDSETRAYSLCLGNMKRQDLMVTFMILVPITMLLQSPIY